MSRRSLLAGAIVATSAMATGTGVAAWLTSTTSVVGPLVRILDALSPFAVLVGFVLALVALTLGARRSGAALVVVAVLSGVIGVWTYRTATVPLDPTAQTDLRVLFFNANYENTSFADQIAAAIIEAAPDIAVIAEAAAVLPALSRLQEAYDFVSPCDETTCEVVIATNLAVQRSWPLSLNPIWSDRYRVLEFEAPSGQTVFLAANHLTKPWMSGVSEPEINALIAQYNWLSGPVVAVGDYNMPPWSYALRQILRDTGFRALRGQPGSWPVSGGPFTLPIDLALVRGGVTATHVVPFGADLNSNHLGFVVDVALPPAPD